MKKLIALVCALALALCASAGASAADAGYTLPDSLKSVPSLAENVSLPGQLPVPAKVKNFSVVNGLITLELDREVPSLKIMEINFIEGVESTIFSKKNTASAEAHRTGDETSIFSLVLTWNLDGAVYTETLNTWPGDMTFMDACLTEEADASAFPSWDSARRELGFREDGSLESESWVLGGKDVSLTRTVAYDAGGKAESALVSWASADYDGDLLSAEFSPEGTPLAARCRMKGVNFTVRSLPVNADRLDMENLRDNSYDPVGFSESITSSYPALAAQLFDLFATATDLPAVEGEGAATDSTRLWEVSFGDFFDSEIFVFASDDPLLVVSEGKITLNAEAKDINGNPVSVGGNAVETPVFDIPAFE